MFTAAAAAAAASCCTIKIGSHRDKNNDIPAYDGMPIRHIPSSFLYFYLVVISMKTKQ